MEMKPNIPFVLIFGLISAFPFAQAFSSGAGKPVQIETIVEMERLSVDNRGREIVSYESAEKVVPGDVVRYTIRLDNTSDKPVDDAEIVTRIPDHMVYLEHSAKGDFCAILYSADGGKSFKSRTQLLERTSDGQLITSPVRHITHIKWHREKSITPGTSLGLSYRARLE